MNIDKLKVDADLESLQHDTFKYFLLWTNPQNGLVRDKNAPDWPAYSSTAREQLHSLGFYLRMEK